MGSGGAAAAAAPERCPAPHPAVLAWGRLTGTAAAATRVSVLKRGHKSQVYRLHGLLDGRAVIAKRCPTGAWDMRKYYIEMTHAEHACRRS